MSISDLENIRKMVEDKINQKKENDE